MAADATFDEHAIRAHVSMLHKLARGVDGELVLAVYGEDPAEFDPRTGKPGKPVHRHVERFQIGDVDGMTAAAMRFSGVPHANVYTPLHVVRCGLGAGQRGQVVDLVAVLGLVADMDADTGHSGEMPIDPSMIVETSPGNLQPITLFDRPVVPADAKPLAECLKAATGSDHGTGDIGHVWRMPGTLNWPNAKKLARGRDASPAPVKVVKAWDGTLLSFEAVSAALSPWQRPPRVEEQPTSDNVDDGSELPKRLFDLIRDGVEVGRRSDQFMHAVAWLKDLGWTSPAVHDLFYQHSNGIAEKYEVEGRLRQEVDRCYGKARCKVSEEFAGVEHVGKQDEESLLIWHGDEPPQPAPWLVQGVLPEAGVALLAGQYSAGKTFVGFDLAGAVLTGADFLGQKCCRRGGVLWLAAEGEAEVNARLSGVMNGKLRAALDEVVDLKRLAFARQKFEVPSLSDKDAQDHLARLAGEAEKGMRTRFDLPLALIVIDTLAAAAVFDDENSASETQKVMEVLKSLSRSTGALVLAIDHHGKTVETGPRGSSAKGAAADAILAVLADKSEQGDIKHRRLAVSKVRNGPTGRVVPFELRQTQIGGTSETTCFVEWHLDNIDQGSSSKQHRSPWTGRSRILKSSMDTSLRAFTEVMRPFGEAGPMVATVDREKVRDEFFASLSATEGAKRQAFRRAQEDATGRGLIMCREIGGRDMLWFKTEGMDGPQLDRPDSPLGGCPVRPGASADADTPDICPACPLCPGAEVPDGSPCGNYKGAAGD